MRRILLQELTNDDAKLGKTVYDSSGRCLLRQGTILGKSYREKLVQMGITSVMIEDDISEGIEIDPLISEETQRECMNSLKDLMEKYISTGNVNSANIVSSVNSIITDVVANKEMMVQVSDIRSKDTALLAHSLNVCSLSVIVGLKLGYNMPRLKEVAIGSILHDLGKAKGSIDQEHPKVGYEALRTSHEISSISKVIVLMHHEACDGTGFPLKLKKDEIHETARLVSICNTYDNLIYGHGHHEEVPVYQVIEYMNSMHTKLDATILKKFLEIIAVYPNGTLVKLSNGIQGIVIRQNKGYADKPVVKVLNKNGHQLIGTIIDLVEHPTMIIIESNA